MTSSWRLPLKGPSRALSAVPVGGLAVIASIVRTFPATSMSAALAAVLMSTILMKPCTSGPSRRSRTWLPAARKRRRVGLALVPERVEAGRDDQRGRQSGQVRGAQRGEPRVGAVDAGRVVAVEPVDLGAGEEEAVREQLVRRVGLRPVGPRVEQQLVRERRRRRSGRPAVPPPRRGCRRRCRRRPPAASGSAPSSAACAAAQRTAAQASSPAAGNGCSGASR